jgi:hypothetical protein
MVNNRLFVAMGPFRKPRARGDSISAQNDCRLGRTDREVLPIRLLDGVLGLLVLFPRGRELELCFHERAGYSAGDLAVVCYFHTQRPEPSWTVGHLANTAHHCLAIEQ